MAGQSFGDRIAAAQHTLVGSDMLKSVCKASTTEVMGPKKKHLAYLQALTNEQNVSIPELADSLIERSKQGKWVVVFKSLITTHHLLCYGNEKFIQHLASRNSLYSLSNFLDKTGMQGYDMSTYIRKYSLYLNEKAIAYRTVAYDFTRIRRGKDGLLRSLDSEKLIKALPVLQKLVDALLEFDARPNDLINGVINAAFLLLFKDLIRLFACYNDGIINLLEKYFTMKKAQCRESLDLYKKFLTRMNRVSEMLKVADQVGVDKGDIPDLTKAPNSLLDALEQHLAHLEGKRPEGGSATAANVSAFNSISSTLNKIDASAQQFALDEEKSKLEAFKKQREEELKVNSKPAEPSPSQQQSTLIQPPASAASSASSDLLDIFATSTPASNPSSSSGFDSNFSSLSQPPTTLPASTQNLGFQQQPFGMNTQSAPAFPTNAAPGWGTAPPTATSNAFGFNQTATVQPNLFEKSPFSNSTGDTSAAAGLLQPIKIGEDQQTQPQFMPQQQVGGNKNLESSLANAVANLTVSGQRANQNFEPKMEKKLTGGVNYNPTITPSPMTFNSAPMVSGMTPQMGSGMTPQVTPGMGAPSMATQQPMYGNNMMWNTTNMAAPPQVQPFGMAYQQPQMRMLNPNNPFGSM